VAALRPDLPLRDAITAAESELTETRAKAHDLQVELDAKR
jgi:hypothetical protein